LKLETERQKSNTQTRGQNLHSDLALRCVIGVYSEERREKQDVIINLVLECNHAAAAQSDQLADAVDYKEIKKEIIELVEASEFHLIETLAIGSRKFVFAIGKFNASR